MNVEFGVNNATGNEYQRGSAYAGLESSTQVVGLVPVNSGSNPDSPLHYKC